MRGFLNNAGYQTACLEGDILASCSEIKYDLQLSSSRALLSTLLSFLPDMVRCLGHWGMLCLAVPLNLWPWHCSQNRRNSHILHDQLQREHGCRAHGRAACVCRLRWVLRLIHQAVGLTTHAAVLLTRALGRCLLLVTSQLFVCVGKMRRPTRA